MNKGTIIILNGTSSSGKTSIVKALQEVLDEPYLDAGIDKFLFMLPKRYLNEPLWHQVFDYLYADPITRTGLASKLGRWDVEVDTSISGPRDCALQINRRMEDGPPPQAFHQLAENMRIR